ncbi:hypothetical protein EXN66_Car012236 [Channa argus]|uniref:Uncharacterized protein n=1 Tax=Channa argus TaxID=215402 RepID=A0A6G1Q2S1_CHAAH|nr:hypothetical protein EXN66_Car012236 [Channa argus]
MSSLKKTQNKHAKNHRDKFGCLCGKAWSLRDCAHTYFKKKKKKKKEKKKKNKEEEKKKDEWNKQRKGESWEQLELSDIKTKTRSDGGRRGLYVKVSKTQKKYKPRFDNLCRRTINYYFFILPALDHITRKEPL